MSPQWAETERAGPVVGFPDTRGGASVSDIWTERAGEQLEEALTALHDPSAASDDVIAAIELADLAFRISLGERGEDEWPSDDGDAMCICPEELLDRGGFKGRCPVHGSVAFYGNKSTPRSPHIA